MSCEVEWNAAMHVIIKHPIRSGVAGVPGTHEGFVTELCDPWQVTYGLSAFVFL